MDNLLNLHFGIMNSSAYHPDESQELSERKTQAVKILGTQDKKSPSPAGCKERESSEA